MNNFLPLWTAVFLGGIGMVSLSEAQVFNVDGIADKSTINNHLTIEDTNAILGVLRNLFQDSTTSRIGIGTSSPSATLEIRGDAGEDGSLSLSGDGGLYFGRLNFGGVSGGNSTTGWNLGRVRSSDSLHLGWNGSDTVFFGKNGNVGIGTTTPTEKLHVEGNAKFSGKVRSASTVSTDHASTLTTKDYVDTKFSESSDTDWIESNGNVYRSSGNVGIGITTPQSKLHIKETNSDSPTVITVENTETGNLNDPGIQLKSRNSDYYIFANDETNQLYFWDSAVDTQRMTILGNGNVGINTANPTQKFDVDGKIRMREQTVATDSGDTVVTKDFMQDALKDLSESTSNIINETTVVNGSSSGIPVYTCSVPNNSCNASCGHTGNLTMQQQSTYYFWKDVKYNNGEEDWYENECVDGPYTTTNTIVGNLVGSPQVNTLFTFDGQVDSRAEITIDGTTVTDRTLDEWRGIDWMNYFVHPSGPSAAPDNGWKVEITSGPGTARITYHQGNVMQIEVNDDGGPSYDHVGFRIVRK